MVTVPMRRWGKDHWSTFAYIETRIVDHGGQPNLDHMRVDIKIHPLLGNRASRSSTRCWPTILRDGEQCGHDDWSCLDDCEAEGLINNTGSGLRRAYVLTEKGHRCAAALRKHKAEGGSFSAFVWTDGGET